MNPSKLAFVSRSTGILLSFLVLSVLELEIALTRVFAAMLHSHMVLLVLSLTICGLGLGGMFVSAWLFYAPKRFREQAQSAGFVDIFLFLFALSIYPMLWGILQTVEASPDNSLLSSYYLILIFWATVPFVLAGVAISSLFECYSEKAEELYFYDLCGASLGCLTVILLIELLGGPISAILSIPVFLLLIMALNHWQQKKRYWTIEVCCSIVATWILLMVTPVFSFSTDSWAQQYFTLDYHKVGKQTPIGKALAEDSGKIVATKWDSYSRTDFVEYSGNPKFVGEKQLFINTGKRARMLKEGFSLKRYKRDLAYLPFHYQQKLKGEQNFSVLNLGSGGGYDAELALDCQASAVTLVEINPLVVDFVEEEQQKNPLFHRPKVRVYVDEGRSFIRKTQEKYDVIHSSLTSTLAVEEATQLSFYESYFYTVEAFEEYLAKLKPDGILSIIIERDDLRDKIVTTFLKLFQKKFHIEPAEGIKQLAILHLPRAAGAAYSNLILAKKTPFKKNEIQQLEKLIPKTWQGYFPTSAETRFQMSPFKEIATKELDVFGSKGWIETYQLDKIPFNIEPPTDDCPFFFNNQVGLNGKLLDLSEKVFFYVVLLPLMLFFYPRETKKDQIPLWKFGIAFFLLGMGFMILEVALLKQFTLYLSYPTLTLSTTLFGILFAAGLGAYLTQAFSLKKKLFFSCCFIFVVSCCLIWIIPMVIEATLGLHTAIRCFICLLFVSSLGFALGIPFPCLLRLLKKEYPGWVPLAFALNGSMSVLGSSIMMLISLEYGITIAFFFGACIYAVIPLLFLNSKMEIK